MSHIKNIEIKNFKSIRHAIIDNCKRVNVFIGYPNVGKSNILEALGLYSIVLLKKFQDFQFDAICRVKNFSELFFDGDYRNSANLVINNKSRIDIKLQDISSYLDIGFSNNDALTTGLEDVYDNKVEVRSGGFSIDFSKLGINLDDFIGFDIKKYSFTNRPPSQTARSFALNIPFGTNLFDILLREKGLRKDLGDLLKYYSLQLLLEKNNSEIKLLKQLEDDSAVSIPYHQIAETLKRLIFFKAAIATNENSVLVFEEPEAHMFPPYIRKLTADIVMDKNNNQYFVATHSPYVLDELILEGGEDLSVYLVDYKNGETIIHPLSSDDLIEMRQYGVDLLFNIESYLKHGETDHS